MKYCDIIVSKRMCLVCILSDMLLVNLTITWIVMALPFLIEGSISGPVWRFSGNLVGLNFYADYQLHRVSRHSIIAKN